MSPQFAWFRLPNCAVRSPQGIARTGSSLAWSLGSRGVEPVVFPSLPALPALSEAEASEVEGSEVEGSEVEGSEAEGSEVEGSEVEGSEVEGSEVEGKTRPPRNTSGQPLSDSAV